MKRSVTKKILKKETAVTLALYLLFFLWWYITSYCTETDPSKYSYIFGFPRWFFLSCIAGYIGISVLLWLCVKFFFKDIPFDNKENSDE